jgi:tetratricopeptide (TPR) repeat protein
VPVGAVPVDAVPVDAVPVDAVHAGAAPVHEDAYARAVRLWREGRGQAALAVLAAQAHRSPLLPGVHYLSGLILLDRGRIDAALAAFRRCTYLDPRFVLGHLGQAGALVRAGQRRRAGAALDSAARLVADLDRESTLLDGDGPGVAEVCELIAAQRLLLDNGNGGRP